MSWPSRGMTIDCIAFVSTMAVWRVSTAEFRIFLFPPDSGLTPSTFDLGMMHDQCCWCRCKSVTRFFRGDRIRQPDNHCQGKIRLRRLANGVELSSDIEDQRKFVQIEASGNWILQTCCIVRAIVVLYSLQCDTVVHPLAIQLDWRLTVTENYDFVRAKSWTWRVHPEPQKLLAYEDVLLCAKRLDCTILQYVALPFLYYTVSVTVLNLHLLNCLTGPTEMEYHTTPCLGSALVKCDWLVLNGQRSRPSRRLKSRTL